MYWFYWPIFSLFPRALHLKMNIIIKKQKLENPGIDPGASRMQIERSTTWANPPCALILFTNLFIISSWVAISNEYNYKEKEIGESGYRPGASRMQIERSTTWANPPCALILFTNLFIISSWVAISNEYNYKETGIGEFGIDPGDSRIQIDRSTTWANPLVHCFYWPIFSLFPRELQLAMNIIRKKEKLENPGIDPGASRIQIERSTT